MTETNLKVLELINQNKNLKQIASILGMSEKQLYMRIKQLINYGYNINPSYSYSSDIYYSLIKKKVMNTQNDVTIKMPKNINEFRCIVVSDLHIGSKDSDIKLMDIVYNYAAKKGINIILNCGDTVEGDYTTCKKSIKDIHGQLENFIKKHPYDKNINNFMIFGNHDYHSLHYDGLDMSKIIKNSRYDIIPIGYGQGIVNIKDDGIILFHKLYEGFKPMLNNNEKILLSGHSHMMKTKVNDLFWLSIPTLSHNSTDNTQEVLPGFVDLHITLENQKFDYLTAKHIMITPKIIQASESKCRIKTLFTDKRWK